MKQPAVFLFFISLFFCEHTKAQDATNDYVEQTPNSLLLGPQFKQKHNGYILLQSSFNLMSGPEYPQGSSFSINQLRIQFNGEIIPGLEYDVRQRLNEPSPTENLDNSSLATDWAYLTYTFQNNLFITVGKQWAAYGGFEFDATPTDIYKYSQMVWWKEAFLTGINLGYRYKEQEINFQVANGHTATIESFYGNLPEGFTPAAHPLHYAVNWNGGLFNHLIDTRWSYAVTQEGEEEFTQYLVLGTKLNQPFWQLSVDYHLSAEDLDRTWFASALMPEDHAVLRDTRYQSTLARLDVQPAERWNLFYQMAYTDTYSYDASLGENKGWMYTSQVQQMGVEFQPIKEQPLKLFATYIHEKDLKSEFLNSPTAINKNLMIGFLYKWNIY